MSNKHNICNKNLYQGLENKLEIPEALKLAIDGFPQEIEEYFKEIIIENKKAKEIINYHENKLNKTNEGLMTLTIELEQELEIRKKVEKELELHKQNLEILIEKRAEKLLATNELLRQEINRREKIENELRKSEEKYRFIAENSIDVIWQMDLDLKFVYISPSLKQVAGAEPEEWIGTPLWMHAPKKSYIKIAKQALLAIKNYKKYSTLSFEAEMIGKNDKKFPVEITGKPLFDNDDKLIGLMGSTRDISERKKAEKEILELNEELESKVKQRTKELEEIAEDLESFSYSVSHDLRAPLRHIEGFSQLLLKNTESLDEKSKRYISKIIDSTKSMDSLIDKLLEFSKYGRKTLSISYVDMRNIINDVLVQCENNYYVKNIEFIIEKIKNCYADVQLIRQVWYNFISNAIKYSSKEEHPIVQIGCYVEGRHNIYYIKDNGAGFDMKYYNKLFGVFQRLHSDNDFKGTGIGLANVKRIISKHKGKVWAESEVNKGATFYFAIPIKG